MIKHFLLAVVTIRTLDDAPSLVAALCLKTAKEVCDAFHRLVRESKLVDFRFHDLRHTFATRLAPHTDAFTLAALLGHKTLVMTTRYTHPTDDGKRRAIAVLSGQSEQAWSRKRHNRLSGQSEQGWIV